METFGIAQKVFSIVNADMDGFGEDRFLRWMMGMSEAMAGSSGLMLFGTTDHGKLLSVLGQKHKAIQYVLGNPLIAIQMTRHNLAAGLYAPLRVLIYENEAGATCLEYGLPSSLFGQFSDDRITSVAKMLDRKLEELVTAATSE